MTSDENLDLREVPLKELEFQTCQVSDIRDFIEHWHYSKNVNGITSTHCFRLVWRGALVGAMIFGKLGMAKVWKKYGETEEEVVELRRLVLIDKTKRNAESYFIGRAIRWLKANTNIKVIVSYADETYGHTGVVYKATNFQRKGQTAKGRVIVYQGKRYHDKTIRTYYKGSLKPYAKRIRDALEDGSAYYEESKPKNIYVYELRREKQNED